VQPAVNVTTRKYWADGRKQTVDYMVYRLHVCFEAACTVMCRFGTCMYASLMVELASSNVTFAHENLDKVKPGLWRLVSLKCVEVEEKFLWRAYRNSPRFFWTAPSLTPYGFLFPNIGGLQPHPKLHSLLSQERLELRTSNLQERYGVHPNKSPLKIWWKGSVGLSSDWSNFFG